MSIAVDLPAHALLLGNPLIPADALVLGDRAGVRPTIWQWIKLIVTVGIPNIGSFWRNRRSLIDPRLEEVRFSSYFKIIGLSEVVLIVNPLVHSEVERTKEVRKDRCYWVRGFSYHQLDT